MDPALTRTKAHVLFGEIYNKPRSPEWQARIDEAIKGISDIYVRIHKMQEVDEEYERTNRRATAQDREAPGQSPRPPVAAGSGPKRSDRSAATDLVDRLRRLITSLFGRSDLAQWGESTGTISSGLLGMNLRLTSQVESAFTGLSNAQVVELTKAFRLFIQKGWESLPPQKYNAVVTAHQFLEEYLKAEVLFRKEETPSAMITQTTKLQVFYAQTLQYPDLGTILREDLVAWVEEQKDPSLSGGDLDSALNAFLGFEARRPKLTDCILAFYVVERRRLVGWSELCVELKLHAPVVDRYRAPEKTMTIIQQRVDKLKSDLEMRRRSVASIELVRSKYFALDDKGRADVDFVQGIARDVLMRNQMEGRVSADFIKSTMLEPHRLMSVLLKDIDMNFFPILCGSVHAVGSSGPAEIIIFRPGVLKSEVDLLSEAQQELAEFLKRYKNSPFTFGMYLAASKGEAKDPVSQGFSALATRGNTLFSMLASKLQAVCRAHDEACEKEEAGTLKEALVRTKSIPIEATGGELRFLPWAEFRITGTSRFNDLTVNEVVEEMVHCLYNYLYIFRDPGLLNTLGSIPRLKSEIGMLEKKLLQYGSAI